MLQTLLWYFSVGRAFSPSQECPRLACLHVQTTRRFLCLAFEAGKAEYTWHIIDNDCSVPSRIDARVKKNASTDVVVSKRICIHDVSCNIIYIYIYIYINVHDDGLQVHAHMHTIRCVVTTVLCTGRMLQSLSRISKRRGVLENSSTVLHHIGSESINMGEGERVRRYIHMQKRCHDSILAAQPKS